MKSSMINWINSLVIIVELQLTLELDANYPVKQINGIMLTDSFIPKDLTCNIVFYRWYNIEVLPSIR